MDYLEEHRLVHAELIQPKKGKTIGCPLDDVLELEREIGFDLPEAYRQYLLWMGRDYNGIFVGSDWFLGDALENTKYVPELLQESNIEYQLPDHYLAFFGHQAYMYAWFILPKESDDPPVYFFGEEKEQRPPHITGIFTEFLYRDMLNNAFLAYVNEHKRDMLSFDSDKFPAPSQAVRDLVGLPQHADAIRVYHRDNPGISLLDSWLVIDSARV